MQRLKFLTKTFSKLQDFEVLLRFQKLNIWLADRNDYPSRQKICRRSSNSSVETDTAAVISRILVPLTVPTTQCLRETCISPSITKMRRLLVCQVGVGLLGAPQLHRDPKTLSHCSSCMSQKRPGDTSVAGKPRLQQQRVMARSCFGSLPESTTVLN